MRPVVCLITDRRAAGSLPALVTLVRAAGQAGIDLVQVRERDLDGKPLLELVRRLLEVVHGTRARVLVNDRLDVALAAGAHGVHLRGDSFAADRARTIAPRGFLIGRSVHAAGDITTGAAAPDYWLFGGAFATPSKSGRAPTGAGALAAAAAATAMPVLAVGGVQLATLPQVAQSGAAGFAAISLFAGTPLDRLTPLVDEARRIFAAAWLAPRRAH